MKKSILVVLILVILVSLCSCGKAQSVVNEQKTTPSATGSFETTTVTEQTGVTPTVYSNNPEILRAVAFGFVPNEILSDWKSAVTFSQFSSMVSKMMSLLGQDLAAKWETSAKDASQNNSLMKRDSGMVGLYYAAEMLGIYQCREDIDNNWEPLHAKIGEPWQDFSNDYSPFGISDQMQAKFIDQNFNYGVAGYLFSMCRISLVSGKTLFDYDEAKNSMRPGDPLTREEAISAVLRLYESVYRPVVVSGSILPPENDTDYAVYKKIANGGDNSFLLTFSSPDAVYPNVNELDATYDLIIPKSDKGFADTTLRSCITPVDMNGKWINRTGSDFKAQLHYDQGGLSLIDTENGNTYLAEDHGNYWLFPIKISSTYNPPSAKGYRQLVLEINFDVPADGFSGNVWVDNANISNTGTTIINYDFNTQYGKPYGELFTTAGLYWGPVSDIGVMRDFNVVKGKLIYDGNPNQPDNNEFLDKVNKDELYNPGFDMRNFTGITLRWKGDYNITDQVHASVDIIFPKEVFDGFQNPDSFLRLTNSVTMADITDKNTVDNFFGTIDIKKDSFGNVYPITGIDKVKITQYDDAYLVSFDATTDYPSTQGKRIWLKVQMTGSEVLYNGFVYLDNWKISSGDNVLVDYKVDPEPMPDNLYQMYDHTNNGSYYWWNSIGSGFSYIGFDILNLPN